MNKNVFIHIYKNKINVAILCCALVLLLSPLFYSSQEASAVTDTYNVSDTWLVPQGVFEVTVEAWGGGAGGELGNAGGGGGGGAYTSGTVPVTPGTTYNITVAASVGQNTNGGSSSFTGDSSLQVLSNGGTTGTGGVGGAGGAATSTAPAHIDTSFAGGAGGEGVTTGGPAGRIGGGGGGSATSAAAGGAGQGGAAGGAGGIGEGNGGDGTNTAGGNGTAPGGGGGGGRDSGGTGAAGRVVLTYTVVPFPTQIQFTTAARTITAGQCSGTANQITIELQDSSNNPTPPLQETVVRVTSNSPSYTLYSDDTCTSPITNGDITFTTVDSAQTFYIIDERRSDPTWTLDAVRQSGDTGITSASQSITVNAGTHSRLVVTLPGQTFTEGSGNSGSPTAQTAGTPFNIAAIRATDDFYNVVQSYTGNRTLTYTGPSTAPDTTAPSYTTSVDFTAGASTTTLTTTLYAAEDTTITVEESGQFGFASDTVTVTPGLLSSFDVTLEAAIVAGACSSVGNDITAFDAWGNFRNTDTSDVLMTSSGQSIVFYTDGSCGTTTTQYSLSAGTAAFYVRSTQKQGSFTVTATKSGDVQTGESNTSVIHPAATDTLVVTLPNQSFTDGTGVSGAPSFSGTRTPNATAGTAFDVTVYAIDQFNNLVDSGPNNYTGGKTLGYGNSSIGNAPDGTPPTTPSTSVSFTNGVSPALSFTLFDAASSSVRVDDTGDTINGTVSTSFTVEAGVKDAFTLTTASATQTAGQSFNVTLTVIDAWENTLGALYSPPVGTYSWTTTASNAADGTPPLLGTLSDTSFTNGVAVLPVTLYRAESGVSFTAQEPAAGISGTLGGITVEAGSTSSAITSSTIAGPSSTLVDSPISVTITLRDAWLNPKIGVAAGDIQLLAQGGASITQPSAPTDSSGQTSGSITWNSRGTWDVTVQVSGTVVEADGSTVNPTGILDDVLTVEVQPLPGSSRLRGGTLIQGGSTVR